MNIISLNLNVKNVDCKLRSKKLYCNKIKGQVVSVGYPYKTNTRNKPHGDSGYLFVSWQMLPFWLRTWEQQLEMPCLIKMILNTQSRRNVISSIFFVGRIQIVASWVGHASIIIFTCSWVFLRAFSNSFAGQIFLLSIYWTILSLWCYYLTSITRILLLCSLTLSCFFRLHWIH